MPESTGIESATNVASTAAWVAGAVVAAYFLGVALSWLLHRLGRRSQVLHDVADLTRRPARATHEQRRATRRPARATHK